MLVVIAVGVSLALAFISGVLVAVVWNRLSGTPGRYVISSGVISAAAYLASLLVLLWLFPPLSPDLEALGRTPWGDSGLLAILPAALCVASWQLLKRKEWFRGVA